MPTLTDAAQTALISGVLLAVVKGIEVVGRWWSARNPEKLEQANARAANFLEREMFANRSLTELADRYSRELDELRDDIEAMRQERNERDIEMGRLRLENLDLKEENSKLGEQVRHLNTQVDLLRHEVDLLRLRLQGDQGSDNDGQ